MAENLRKLRMNRGISRQQLADVIETNQRPVNKYENHSVEPDISALIKLADYFETTVGYLVGHIPLSDQGLIWTLNRQEKNPLSSVDKVQ